MWFLYFYKEYLSKLSTMKRFFIVLLIITSITNVQQAYAQLYPVNIDEKVKNATLIVEGKVVEQRAFWNAKHTMIFTASKVEVYKSFKGSPQSGYIEVMTIGGSVGIESIEASDLLTLESGNIGVFFCYPNAIKLRSPVTGTIMYDVYSSSQGCITYNLSAKTASAPFARYSSIENVLYKELVKKTGQQPVIINNSFDISAQSRPQKPLAPVITSFSPQVVNAGATLDPANNLLTINGSGFGNSPADSAAVLFDDANDGTDGTPFKVVFNSPLVQLWTDNQIQVRVPGRAGTGNFEVRDNLAASTTSPGSITVNYSVLTSQISAGGVTVIKESNLMNQNGNGGYTVDYSTSTMDGGVDLSLAPERVTFERALKTWKEVSGFNVEQGGNTTIQVVASDGINVIMFDNNNTGAAPLADGVLAVCYSYSSMCTPVANTQIQKTGFDIVIRNPGVSTGDTDFTPGPCAPATRFAQTDLETVLLHELGHALNLAHVNDSYQGASLPNINPGKLMNYAVVNGVSRKSLDYAAYVGSLYCINPQSNVYGTCGLPNSEMIPLPRTIAAMDECPLTFPVVSIPANTSVNFDLVHTTSNKFTDPQFTAVNCAGTGTHVTNNAYYAFKTDADGGSLSLIVSNYETYPVDAQTCQGAGVRVTLYKVDGCPVGQDFPDPIQCRTFNNNGNPAAIQNLLANTNYLLYVDGLNNTKATFTLTLGGSVLPVTLVEFKGNLSGGKVDLAWKTSQEINSKEFMVEKSIDGTNFNQFAVVPAKGNSTVENTYNLTDDQPYSGNTFYRLKVLDKDGRFEYSQIVKIKTPKKPVIITKIFPNPTTGKINLQVISDSRKSLTVEAFDLIGKKVATFKVNVESGLNERSVYVTLLASGTYFLQIVDASGTIIEKTKFIKSQQ